MRTFIFAFSYIHNIYIFSLLLAIIVALSACDSKQIKQNETGFKEDIEKKEFKNIQTIDKSIQLKTPTVSILVVKKQEIIRDKEFIGIASPVKSQKVYPETKGIVQQVLVKQNQTVKINQPLYQINTKSAEIALKKTKSELKKAKADLVSMQTAHKQAKLNIDTDSIKLIQAESDLERYEQLIDAGAISQQIYQQAISQVDIIKSSITANETLIAKTIANIEQAKANIDLINDRLKQEKEILQQTTIKAPFSGKVIEINVSEGQKIDEQKDSYITIAKTDSMLVDLKLMTGDYLQFKKYFKDKQEVKLILNDATVYKKSGLFKLDEVTINKNNKNGKTHKIKEKKSNINEKKFDKDSGSIQDQYVKLQVLFKNDDGQLLPNMKVNARVSIHDRARKILIPLSSVMYFPIYSYKSDKMRDAKSQKFKVDSNTAHESEFTKDNKQHFVYILDGQNIIQKRFISVNGLLNKQVIVSDGLEEGDKVIVDSDTEIRVKQKVLVNTANAVNIETPSTISNQKEKNDHSKINE